MTLTNAVASLLEFWADTLHALADLIEGDHQ